VAPGPVGDQGVGVHILHQLAGHPRRGEEVVELEAHAGDAVFHAVERLGVLQVDERQAGVVLEHPHLEDAHHRELLEPRQDRRRRDEALGRDQGHLLAQAHPQRPCQVGPQHDAEGARLQIVKAAEAHVLGEVGHLVLGVRQHAADQRAAHGLVEGQHALGLHEGRRGAHLRVSGRVVGDPLPVGQLAVEAGDLHMGRDAQDARAQLGLEAVHHRQHDDQRRHAEGNAQHRDQRNEGYEAIAALRPPPGAGVAQPDEEFVGHQQ